MKHMDELRDMLCEELDKIAEQGELNAGSLDMVDKLTHSIKSLDTIEAMGGYSNDDMSYRGRSYATRRDSRGRYSRTGRNSYGYSMNDHKDHIIDQLEDMMMDADPSTKSAIKKAIKTLEE